jgi:hypothetical protein
MDGGLHAYEGLIAVEQWPQIAVRGRRHDGRQEEGRLCGRGLLSEERLYDEVSKMSVLTSGVANIAYMAYLLEAVFFITA